MKKDYRGIDGTVGFISAWESQMKDEIPDEPVLADKGYGRNAGEGSANGLRQTESKPGREKFMICSQTLRDLQKLNNCRSHKVQITAQID